MNPPAPRESRAAEEDDAPRRQLNLNVRGLLPSATMAIDARSEDLRRQGRRIFKLGLGQSPFPVPEPVVAALREHAREKDYLPVPGLFELRRTVAARYQEAFGVEIRPEDVLVGPGSKELMFLLQLVYYGDLLVPTPAWVSYAPQAQILGRRVHFLPTSSKDGWRLGAGQLDELCRADPDRPRILILNYPANPTGATYGAADLDALAEVARRYRVILLSDEIYGRLHHLGEHRSIVPFYPRGTIFSSGLSKWCGAGGWRLGIFVFPPHLGWLREAMTAVASETFTSTSAPIQYAAVRAFAGGPEIEAYLADSRRVLRALGGRLVEILRAAGLRVLSPAGAFYLFPDCGPHRTTLRRRGIRTSPELAERLLAETGVAVLPGTAFGREPEELTLRLSYVHFDGARALAEAGKLSPGTEPGEELLRACCGETLEAVERLGEWVKG